MSYEVGTPVALYCPTLSNKDRKDQTPKFQTKWRTGYRVFQIKSPVHVILYDENKKTVLNKAMHIDRIKRAPERASQNPPVVRNASQDQSSDNDLESILPSIPVNLISSSDDMYVQHTDLKEAHILNALNEYSSGPYRISKVVARRQNDKGTWEYRCHFYSFSPDYATWIEYDQLPQDIQNLVTMAANRIPNKTRRSKHKPDMLEGIDNQQNPTPVFVCL